MSENRNDESAVAKDLASDPARTIASDLARVIVVHEAGTATEALVIRGLLESAGIASPAPTTTDPFPLRENPSGTHGVEIMVLESQAEAARRMIAEYAATPAADGEAGSES